MAMEPPPRPSPPTSSSQAPAPAAAPNFPKLEILDPKAPHTFLRPSKRINDGAEVEQFHQTKAYRDIGVFLFQLNRTLCPRVVPPGDQSSSAAAGAGARVGAGSTKSFPLNAKLEYPESIQNLQKLLARLEALIEEAPPDPGPRRFGNISFRKWHALLEERVEGMLKEFLPENILRFGENGSDSQPESEAGPLDELKAYLVGGFGSAQRLDYGTGHELSFLAFLGGLWKLGAFHDAEDPAQPGHAERLIVLGVFEPYVASCQYLWHIMSANG
jgi:serine/threonine-protein phosphatase 2A activator